MSPSESELRAALRHGEGEHVDAGRVIARARQARHSQRVRLAAGAAAVVAVAAVGTGGSLLADSGSHRSGVAGSRRGPASSVSAATRAAGSAPQGRSSQIAAGPLADAAKLACPAAVRRPVVQGGGPAAGGSLFSGPVEAVKVCGYVDASGPLGNTVLTGEPASELAASLDVASTHPLGIACPLPAHAQQVTLVLIGVSRSGAPMPAIVATLACAGTASNGTAVRYGWHPPASLSGFVAALTLPNAAPASPTGRPTVPVASLPGGQVSGSPLH